MKFADRVEARVEKPLARRVRATAKDRGEKPAVIIREALEEYFARRESAPPLSHVEHPSAPGFDATSSKTQAASLPEAA